MDLTINILLIISCLWLALQDFKSRRISLWLALTTGMLIIVSFFYNDRHETFKEVIINIAFVALLFIIFLFLAWKKEENVFNMIGEGDWFMLFLFTFSFSILGYTSFILISYTTAIFSTLAVKLIQKKENPTVPLAGVLCMTFVFQLLLKLIIPEPTPLLSELLVK